MEFKKLFGKKEGEAATPTKKKKHRVVLIVGGIILLLLILWGIMWYQHTEEMKKINGLADQEAVKIATGNSQATNTDKWNMTQPQMTIYQKAHDLINDTASHIINDRNKTSQAKDYASYLNISFEQAVVDMAIAQLKALGYIQNPSA